jgi:hypothetical protein
VRALQGLSGGRSIEVGWAPVDAQSGRFAFSLATDAPVRATYAANPAALAFVADPTSVAKVTLEATSGTRLKLQPIDLFALPASVTFTFP